MGLAGYANDARRRQVCKDTLDRTPTIVEETKHLGATLDSTFHKSQMPPLPRKSDEELAKHVKSKVGVVNADAFFVARGMMDMDESVVGKVAVLNLASDIMPAGPWLQVMTTTQEEALCYSSTLYKTLTPSYYPWPNLGKGSVAGFYSPGVAIFKDTLDNDCVDLPVDKRRVVGVMTVAAPAGPDTTVLNRKLPDEEWVFRNESDLNDLREKIRLVYRMAGADGKEYLVLGAMGCGAYACPPKQIAREMRGVLEEEEFTGYFKMVVFAVYGAPDSQGERNFGVFKKVLDGAEI